MSLTIIKDFNLKTITNICVSSGDANEIVPVDFYKFDADEVIVINKDDKIKDTIRVYIGTHCSSSINSSITGSESFFNTIVKKSGINYIVDLKRREFLGDEEEGLNNWKDWGYVPLDKESASRFAIKTILMFNHTKRKFYSSSSIEGSVPSLIFALGYIKRMIKLDNHILMSDVGKQFTVNLICKVHRLTIPNWSRFSLERILLNPTVDDNSLPKDLFINAIQLGESVMEDEDNDEANSDTLTIKEIQREKDREDGICIIDGEPTQITLFDYPKNLEERISRGVLDRDFEDDDEVLEEENKEWAKKMTENLSNMGRELTKQKDGTFISKIVERNTTNNINLEEEKKLEIESCDKKIKLSEFISLKKPLILNPDEYPTKIELDIPLDEFLCKSAWLIADKKLILYVRGEITTTMVIYAKNIFSGYDLKFVNINNPSFLN